LKALRSCSGGSLIFGGEVPGKDVLRLLIESMVIALLCF